MRVQDKETLIKEGIITSKDYENVKKEGARAGAFAFGSSFLVVGKAP